MTDHLILIDDEYMKCNFTDCMAMAEKLLLERAGSLPRCTEISLLIHVAFCSEDWLKAKINGRYARARIFTTRKIHEQHGSPQKIMDFLKGAEKDLEFLDRDLENFVPVTSPKTILKCSSRLDILALLQKMLTGLMQYAIIEMSTPTLRTLLQNPRVHSTTTTSLSRVSE